MLQRIQTLWLFLAVVCAALAFVFPLSNYALADNQVIIYKLIPNSANIETMNFYQQSPAWVLVVLNCVFIVLGVFTIMLYKNRPLQMKVLALAFLVVVAYTCVWFFYEESAGLARILDVFYKGREDMIPDVINNAKTIYGVASYFPVAEMILLIFARNGIRKDEKLVRSSNSIR